MQVPAAPSGRELLARVPLFQNLEPEELDELLAVAHTQRVAARSEVFRQGDRGTQVFVILSGCVKVVAAAGGDDVVLGILGPGEIFGELALLAGGERTATLEAIEPSELLAIDRRDFLPILRARPDVAIKLLEVLAERMRRVDHLVQDMRLALPSRLARKLLDLCDTHGKPTESGVRIALPLSQRELGDLIGATRESINRQMREWTAQGVLGRQRGWVIVQQPEFLARIAEMTLR